VLAQGRWRVDLHRRGHWANVKRWRDGQMALRWCAAGMAEAAHAVPPRQRRMHLRALRAALERHIADAVGPHRYGPTETAA
jgi:putative transposase